MANEQNLIIKGTADFSSVTKEVKRLTGTISSSLGKDGVSLFDDKSIKFLKTESQVALTKAKNLMGRLTDEAKKLNEQLKDSTLTEQKNNEILEKRAKNLRKISDLGREIKKLKEQEQRIDRRPSIGGAVGRGVGAAGRTVGGAAQDLPGAGGLAARSAGGVARAASGTFSAASSALGGGAAGMAGGVLAATGVGAIFAAATAAAVAIYKSVKAFEYFNEQVPGLLTKAAFGLGAGISSRTQAEATRLGFSPQETIQTELEAARAFGTMGRGRRERENLGINTQMAARTLGMDTGQITGAANQLRGTLGVRGAESATAQILSRAMTAGMDRSQATHFLSSTVSVLSEINKSGLMSNDQIIAAMGALTKGNMMSPEQAARTLTGMQGAITGSTGETNAFFQRAFARQGIGGGSLFGAQYAVKQGIMGVDPSEFLRQTGGNKQGLEDLRSIGLVQDKDFMQRRAKGILGEAGAIGFNEQSREGRLQKAAFVGQQFGVQTLPESIKLVSILEKLAKGDTLSQKEQKIMKSLGQDPEAKWRDETLKVLNNIAGNTARVKAGREFADFRLGESVAGTMNKLIQADTELTGAVKGLTDAILGKTSGDSSDQSISGRLLKGESLLDIGVDKVKSMLGFGATPVSQSTRDSFTSAAKLTQEQERKLQETPIDKTAIAESLKDISVKLDEGNKDRRELAKKTPGTAITPKVNRNRAGGQ